MIDKPELVIYGLIFKVVFDSFQGFGERKTYVCSRDT